MKVVLLQDIANVGQKLEIKEVANGFALNFLIPQGKAKFADKGVIANLESARERQSELKKEQDESMKKTLTGSGAFEIIVKANEEGHLFAKIDANKIADCISEKTGKKIKGTEINLENPIKEIGDHQIEIQIGEEKVNATLQVKAE